MFPIGLRLRLISFQLLYLFGFVDHRPTLRVHATVEVGVGEGAKLIFSFEVYLVWLDSSAMHPKMRESHIIDQEIDLLVIDEFLICGRRE